MIIITKYVNYEPFSNSNRVRLEINCTCDVKKIPKMEIIF